MEDEDITILALSYLLDKLRSIASCLRVFRHNYIFCLESLIQIVTDIRDVTFLDSVSQKTLNEIKKISFYNIAQKKETPE